MVGRSAIILVPGLFGFAQIGNIAYFDRVAELLRQSTGIQHITALETAPTGPLWFRVKLLHDAVLKEIAKGAGIVHLIGHSTGGVDIRLLTTSSYAWPGGPTGEDRGAFFPKLGTLISLSAPHKGTPIARRLRGAQEDVIPAVFLASVVAKYGENHVGALGALKKLWGRTELHLHLAATAAHGMVHPALAAMIPGLPDPTAKALHDFLQKIADDHTLIHELTPLSMARLNDAATPRASDPALRLHNFITVAPPPRLHRQDLRFVHGLDPARRLAYVAAHAETSLSPGEFGPIPTGPWVGGEPAGLAAYAATAQDGIVPAASQSLDGTAAGLVSGDHLDVVGHYPGPEHGGITVFDSGADFSDARMKALWDAIGARL